MPKMSFLAYFGGRCLEDAYSFFDDFLLVFNVVFARSILNVEDFRLVFTDSSQGDLIKGSKFHFSGKVKNGLFSLKYGLNLL